MKPGQVNIGYRTDLPPNVKATRQARAKDERRSGFPPTPLNPAGPGQDFQERSFPGDHSDIGHGHGKDNDTNDLSWEPLLYIWEGGRNVGVPFGPLPPFTPTGNTTPHDLSQQFPFNLSPSGPR